MADVWSKLHELAQSGKGPRVALSPGQEIRRPKRRRGRPRVRGATKFGHYLGYRSEKGTRPKCSRRGCTVQLRVGQPCACSPACLKQAVADAIATLALAKLQESMG
jgi:hypothetical protein